VVLLVIFVVHRNRIERDRQAKLKEAYDQTLEGWARAMELRDKETEGHARRVVDLTMKMARVMGIDKKKLVHIYRGALLHDIGKMALPDSILSKTAELNEEEKAIMQSHPTVAYEMLSTVPFLQPALDIPRYHHEWWNGEGYPNGLKEEKIPLAARIFAVVDVWDALLSDRPYRKAWSKEQTIQYLKDQRGKRFDPKIVDTFLALEKDE
jgi:putative nucleotidyltransferase with HDIG domain